MQWFEPVAQGYEGGKFRKERGGGGKGHLRKVRILRHVACETLLSVASAIIREICRGGGGRKSLLHPCLVARCGMKAVVEEAAMRAEPNEATE